MLVDTLLLYEGLYQMMLRLLFLINPTKLEIGKVNNNNVDKMNISIRCKADVTQWRSTKKSYAGSTT